MLDVNCGEDAATVRKYFAADNLSRLKKIVLNVLRLETATAALSKLSLAKKRKLAAWDDTFRMAILGIEPVHDKSAIILALALSEPQTFRKMPFNVWFS